MELYPDRASQCNGRNDEIMRDLTIYLCSCEPCTVRAFTTASVLMFCFLGKGEIIRETQISGNNFKTLNYRQRSKNFNLLILFSLSTMFSRCCSKEPHVPKNHSMHGSAMQCYGGLRFLSEHAIFVPPPHRNPLTDRYESLHNLLRRRGHAMCKQRQQSVHGVCST
jgi:hypothetical protein